MIITLLRLFASSAVFGVNSLSSPVCTCSQLSMKQLPIASTVVPPPCRVRLSIGRLWAVFLCSGLLHHRPPSNLRLPQGRHSLCPWSHLPSHFAQPSTLAPSQPCPPFPICSLSPIISLLPLLLLRRPHVLLCSSPRGQAIAAQLTAGQPVLGSRLSSLLCVLPPPILPPFFPYRLPSLVPPYSVCVGVCVFLCFWLH